MNRGGTLGIRLRCQLAYVRDLEADWTTSHLRLTDARNHALELAEELVGLQSLRSLQPDPEGMKARVYDAELRELTGEPLTSAQELIRGHLSAAGCPTCYTPRS